MGQNYFNAIPWRVARQELGHCRKMAREEFKDGTKALQGKKIVIVGCGAQGLNQGLNLRDSGLDVTYCLRKSAIEQKRQSWKNATENGFKVGTYEEVIPTADVVGNLTPDKQHEGVVNELMKYMKKGSALWYSHGFNIVELGQQIRPDITVFMIAPKGPGTEVRNEYLRGFGVPELIAVHPKNDPEGRGWALAKAMACAHRGETAGVLESSFVAETKSDLMGEQTILCGMLQTGTILCYDKMVQNGIDKGYAVKLIMHGWNVISESLKWGGITNMMDRLSNPAKLRANELSKQIKKICTPLYQEHMDNIISGKFSSTMMADWANNDHDLLTWREEYAKIPFETEPETKPETKVKVNRLLFAESLERVMLISTAKEKREPVTIGISVGKMNLNCISTIGNAEEEIIVETEGKDCTLRFNPKFFIDVLKNIEDEEINISFSTSVSPCLITPTEDTKNFTYIILPLRTND